MLLFPPAGPATSRRTLSSLLLLLAILAIIQISVAQDTTDATDAATTDAATTDDNTATTESASETTGTSTDSSSTESTTSTSSSSTSSIPVVTVPPTADAPYMQRSSTPEGAVFIAVGAVLGFFGLAVLAWRGLVAWSVNRSVRQAAIMHSSETKGLLRSRRKRSTARSRGPSGSNMPFGKAGGAGIAGGSGSDSGGQQHRRGGSGSYGPPKTSKVVPSSNSGLFFSPTAGARMYSSSKRPPNYHPAGYHAAPGADTPQSPPYRQSYNNNTYYTRARSGPSPPNSPILYPTGVYDTHAHAHTHTRYPMSRPISSDNTSNGSLNLASPPQGRAPSEYLEDLFESHGQAPPREDFGRR